MWNSFLKDPEVFGWRQRLTYRNDEIVAYPVGDASLFKTVLNIEKAGYEVVEVLPILRCVVVRLNADQLEKVTQAKNKHKRKPHGRATYQA
jgi:hypothetical protein